MPATFIKRTVSPLRFEPLQPDPDDILCPGSDTEDTLQGHEAKRRRIEQAGEDYLRGKPLYIASASLRGPFFTGWSNPPPPRKRRPEKVNESRRRVSRQGSRSATGSLRPWTAQGHQDAPIEISSHETEASLLTPATHSRQESTNDHINIYQAGPQPSKGPPIQVGEQVRADITRHRPSPATSTSPDRTKQPKPVNVRTSIGPEHDWLKFTTRNTGLPKRSSTSPTPVARPRLSSISRDNQKAQKRAKKVSQAAAERTHDDQGFLEAEKLSNATIVRTRESVPITDEPVCQSDNSVPVPATLLGTKLKSERSPHVLPPSTNLPEFEYHRRSREHSRSPERRSFKEDLEAAKKKARAEKRWRLSFTSGSVKGRNPKGSSANSRLSQSVEHSSNEVTKPTKESIPEQPEETKPGRIEVLPEAQIVQDAAFKMPSGLSTGVLETDKLPIQDPRSEDGDSYLGLSTQAAMLKAQDTFQNDLVSSTDKRDERMIPRCQVQHVHDAVDDGSHAAVDPDHTVPGTKFQTPQKDNEPTNTQAMIDAMSPFAQTTIRKGPSPVRRCSSTPSGSRRSSLSPAAPNFDNTSLSMSTSPSPTPAHKPAPIPLSALSKPTSSVTSFSIAPNGTMTEVFQQDRQLPQDYMMGDMDLNAAIEEAGSFLGEWNLERETRNQERSIGSKASMVTASRSH
ncbi:MAG: hypothetical protein Q9168_003141 [Polycauliona sp. 1 TL-2023]